MKELHFNLLAYLFYHQLLQEDPQAGFLRISQDSCLFSILRINYVDYGFLLERIAEKIKILKTVQEGAKNLSQQIYNNYLPFYKNPFTFCYPWYSGETYDLEQAKKEILSQLDKVSVKKKSRTLKLSL